MLCIPSFTNFKEAMKTKYNHVQFEKKLAFGNTLSPIPVPKDVF